VRSERDFSSSSGDLARSKIEDEVRALLAQRFIGSYAPKKSAKSSNQFGESKRLHLIIICARIETEDAVFDSIASGE
jgi:hypothetical protein